MLPLVARLSLTLATSFSYDTGFFGGTIALASFRTAFGITSANSSNTSANLVSLFQAGSFFGAGLQLPMTTRFGRKWSIIISNLIFIVSAIVQTFANGSVGTMMGGEQSQRPRRSRCRN
jgi:MFS family permease